LGAILGGTGAGAGLGGVGNANLGGVGFIPTFDNAICLEGAFDVAMI
jgi:hypothetical protein